MNSTKSKQINSHKKGLLCLVIYIILFFNGFSEYEFDKLTKIFENRCYDCHDEDLKKGGVQLDNPKLIKHELLEKAFKAVRGGHMPPPSKKPLSKENYNNILSVLSAQLEDKTSTQNTPRRMTKTELIYSLEDLLGIRLKSTFKNYISNEQNHHGFDVSSNLGLSDHHLNSYYKTIHAAIDQALTFKQPSSKMTISPRFIYDRHARRPKIITDRPTTIIKHQPRTANGTAFPYFRKGFICEEEGTYDIEFNAKPLSPESTIMLFAGVYYKDGALVFERPRLLKCMTISKPENIITRVYLHKGDEIGFSALSGTSFEMDNPLKIKGPILEAWPSQEVLTVLKPAKPNKTSTAIQLGKQSHQSLKQCLLQFTKQAYRKNIRGRDIEKTYQLSIDHLNKGNTWLESLKVGMTSILFSPDFLFINQSSDPNILLAERLSFTLWKSIPDQNLLELALNGKLNDKKILSQMINQLIKNPKSERFIKDFSQQWMQLKQIKSIGVNYKLYPEYDIYLRDSMLRETQYTFRDYLHANRPLVELIDSNSIFINEVLAKHYNIKGIKGDTFRKVTLSNDHLRGGLLTQASLMMATADGYTTTPVKRGLWVSEQFLNRYIPEPPKNVPALSDPKGGKLSILEQLAMHRNKKDCRSCHKAIDPYGVAFERFNPIGGERFHYRKIKDRKNATVVLHTKHIYKKGEPVVNQYKMPNGKEYKNVREFKDSLKTQLDRVYNNMTEKIYQYILGRPLDYKEHLLVDEYADQAYKEQLGFKDVLHLAFSSALIKKP